MKIALVTDAWEPQINGVVVTLLELVRELEHLGHTVAVIHPGQYRTRPCPGYPGIDIAVRPARQLRQSLQALAPAAVHIATEGPLGWAARRFCLREGLAFTTAFHTRFPEILQAALGIPLPLGYALFRHFHRPSSGVMVPTQGVLDMLSTRGFRQLRPWTHGVDTRLFAYAPQPRADHLTEGLMRPISLFVGRVSYEKNIAAFLALDTPGTKIVCGVGPLEDSLRQRYPQVRWLGVLPRAELAGLYASSDVFVFPSRSDTFGLVMLEAMACGTPVAAYRAEGPNAVVADNQGGCLHDDLREAFFGALAVPRSAARARALAFGWDHAAALFASHLVPVRAARPVHAVVTAASQSR
jgi:glycosyltransferase involved in cell wall biosynthesis